MIYSNDMSYHEQHSRSIAKAISYRVISICADLTIVYLITHKIEMTIGIVVLSNSVSIVLYYLHERAWNRVHFGRRIVKERKDDFINQGTATTQ